MFIDTASLDHAAKAGLGGVWTPGQPEPPTAATYLEQLFGDPGDKLVINDLILEEITRGSVNDDGFLENWIREKIR